MAQPTNSTTATARSTYDLVLLLDTEADQGARAGVLKEVMQSISSDGELLRHDRWGNRELAYPIKHRHQAEYHLLQFQPSKAELLHGLDRSLSIADEVLRFRIVKLKPGTPEPPDMGAGAVATGARAVAQAPVPDVAPGADSAAEAPEATESARSAAPESEDAAPDAGAKVAADKTEAGSAEEGTAAAEPA
jgi:small subunit ribosomal protein S6